MGGRSGVLSSIGVFRNRPKQLEEGLAPGKGCRLLQAGAAGTVWNRSGGRRQIAAAAAVMSMLWASSSAMAAEWLVEPLLNLGLRYDDNIGLDSDNGEEVRAITVGAGAQFSRNTEVWRTQARALFSYVDYDNLRDRDQQLLELSSRYRAQRHVLGLTASLRRDTTFTVRDDEAIEGVDVIIDPDVTDGIEGPDLPDVGVADVQIRRDRIILRPSWEYDLTRRTAIGLGYRLYDVSYDDEPGADLVDHTTHAVEGRFIYRLAPNETISAVVEVARFEADERDAQTDNVSLLATYDRAFSPVLRTSFSLGVRDSSVEEPGVDESSTGVILRVGLTRELEAGRISLRAGRDVRPSGVGEVVETDRVEADFARDLTPRLTFVMSGTAFKLRSVRDDGGGRADRDYFRIQPGLRYALTRTMDIEASYRYRWQDREADPGSAESNSIMLRLRYIGRL